MYTSPPFPALANTPLLARRILLRPYSPSDEAQFYQLIHTNRSRLQPAFPTREAAVQLPTDATQVLAQFQQDWASGRLYVFGIWHSTTKQYLGDISLKPNWTEPVTAEIGYYLSAEAEGHGYAREALGLTVQFGFETLKVERLLIRCQTSNPRSCAVAEALGFEPLAPRPRPWPLRRFSEPDIRYYIRRQTTAV